ncbi:MAG: potassium transporter TrkG [Planctomycetota bacterium]
MRKKGIVLQASQRRIIDAVAGQVEIAVAAVAVVVLVVHLGGYDQGAARAYRVGVDAGIITCFVAARLLRLAVAAQKLEYLSKHRLEFVSMAVVIALLTVAAGLGIMQAYIVLVTVFRTVEVQRLIAGSRLHPARTIVISYLVIVALGAALLASPRAQAGPPARFIDALFTATSATCVTGLVVRDTGAEFSRFGQTVILVLIQVGGLGLMTFTTFFAMVLGHGMGLRERVVMQDALNTEMMGKVGRLVVQVLGLTFVIEAAGAAALYFTWPDPVVRGAERAYFSVFHAVSAFCNAGFCLYSDSFERFAGSGAFVLAVAALIVFGGLGFGVLTNVLGVAWRRVRWNSKALVLPSSEGRGAQGARRLSVHSKVVLVTTAVLLAAGTLVLFATESFHSWGDMPLRERTLCAFFQSVTARTAGFSTANIGAMGNAGILVLLVLMFIGASPGSTGGGVKTSTFAINVLAAAATVRGRSNIEAFRRTISPDMVKRAFVIITLGACAVATSTFLLLLFEGGNMRDLSFEAMSAFGTVGLSTGVTRGLSDLGKLVIALTVFVGRIGPLTMMVAISRRGGAPASYGYPTARLTIG